jgi:hypothetical protein
MDNAGNLLAGEQFDTHERERILEEILLIKKDRKDRLKRLAGKYVIITDGKSSGKLVFYQDQMKGTGLSFYLMPMVLLRTVYRVP